MNTASVGTQTQKLGTESSSPIQARFKDYASYHKTPGNQATHMFGIPMIALALLGLLGHVTLGSVTEALSVSEYLRLDAGTAFWSVAMIWYIRMDWKLGLPFGLVMLGLYFVGRTFPVPALWGLFFLGWGIQYFGHIKYEKQSPAFYKNAEHLLVGPFWLFAKLVGYRQPDSGRNG